MDKEGALRELHRRQYRPVITLCETWQDEAGGIAAAVWGTVDPATGAGWSLGASGAYIRATSAPNANETCQLYSVQRWPCGFGVWGDNTILRQLIMEFEMKLTNVANMDNSLSIFGLTSATADDRSDQNLIGFALTGDALQTLTDAAGTETTNTGFGETLTNWNRFGLIMNRHNVRFLLNGTVIATHAANVPAAPLYLNFFVDTEAGGAATIELGQIRVWPEDSVRY